MKIFLAKDCKTEQLKWMTSIKTYKWKKTSGISILILISNIPQKKIKNKQINLANYNTTGTMIMEQ